ncbi:MAG: hypothetical protein JSS02_25805 [Planctomycetes bacterium]|nr:hypothetical protein [Planctomycetota bacterium]
MTDTVLKLTEDEFAARFPLVPNRINSMATWAFDNGPGCLFETIGPEFEHVRRYNPRKVWTVVDGDDGDMFVINGHYMVNRVGYLLSRDPAPENAVVEVRIPMTDNGESPL